MIGSVHVLATSNNMAREQPTVQGSQHGSVHEGPTTKVELNETDIGRLIEQQYPALRRVIFRQTGNLQDASDLLNDAICVTYQKWREGKLGRPDQVGGYVYQVAMNLLRNRRRAVIDRADRRADPEVLEALPSNQVSHDEAFENRMARLVREMISGMDSHRDRIVLVRFYLDEEDKDTICSELGLSSVQFIKILHRARSRLRHLMEAHGFSRTDFFAGMLL